MRKFTGDTLLVATHNAGKLDEIRALLAPYGVSVVGAGEKGLAVPDETETTLSAMPGSRRMRRPRDRAAGAVG